MARYKIQLYNVPDQHRYGWLPARAWRMFLRSSWQIRLAITGYGVGTGMIVHLVMRSL